MRIWSLHPAYLDARGLVALWRETLLAQAVLRGETKGYRRHPQLERFHARPSPLAAIATYLRGVEAEAVARGYGFDAAKIGPGVDAGPIPVTRGQLEYEWRHLQGKLAVRDPERAARQAGVERPRPHPLFRAVAGPLADWERTGEPAVGRRR